MLSEQQLYSFGQIQTSQTWGQPYSDTSSYGDRSLVLGVHEQDWMWEGGRERESASFE